MASSTLKILGVTALLFINCVWNLYFSPRVWTSHQLLYCSLPRRWRWATALYSPGRLDHEWQPRRGATFECMAVAKAGRPGGGGSSSSSSTTTTTSVGRTDTEQDIYVDPSLLARRARLEGAFLGQLVADALSLGTHYEYSSAKIWAAYDMQPIDTLDGPGQRLGGQVNTPGWGSGATNFHPTKTSGDLTDYGDQAVMVLEAMAGAAHKGQLDAGGFGELWRAKMQTYDGYITMANRETLQRMSKGMRGQAAASQVDDMGGAARVGALLLGTADEDELLHWAEAVCTVTHVNSLAVSAAQFVALSAYRVAHLEEVKQVFSGAAAWPIIDCQSLCAEMTPPRAVLMLCGGAQTPEAAMSAAVEQLDSHPLAVMLSVAQAKVEESRRDGPLKKLAEEPLSGGMAGQAVVQVGLTDDAAVLSMAAGEGLVDTALYLRGGYGQMGKASPVAGALPGAMYFILKYRRLATALPANAMVGGDSAARALVVGLILGAAEGRAGIPSAWLQSLNVRDKVEGMMGDISYRLLMHEMEGRDI